MEPIPKTHTQLSSSVIAYLLAVLLVGWTTGCKEEPDALTPLKSPDAAEVSINAESPAPALPPPVTEAVKTSSPSAPPSASKSVSQPSDSSDVLARFRIDDDGNRRTDQQALEYLVMITGLGTDAEGSPTLPVQNLEELVSRKYIRHLPSAPAGQKWHLERGKVSLVNTP